MLVSILAVNFFLLYVTLDLFFPPSGIWSWSLLQFTLVLGASDARKQRPSINIPPPQEVEMLATDLLTGPQGRQSTQMTCSYNINMYVDVNIVAILTTVLMQDGPFFLLRWDDLLVSFPCLSYQLLIRI